MSAPPRMFAGKTVANRRFADADADFEDARYVIVGAPLDCTSTHRRGTGQAPAAIREESYNFETYVHDLGIDLADIPVHDGGDLPVDRPDVTVPEAVGEILGAGKLPLILGGEHSVTPYAASAFGEVSALVFDAHLDYRDEYLGNRNSHACAIRRTDEAVSPGMVLPVGVRSMCLEEKRDAERMGLDYITADRAKEMGTDMLARVIGELMSGGIYVSVDMDGIDPSFAPGVGTPEPFGLDPRMVRDVIRRLAPRIVGLDVVEVCPPFDNGNTSSLAAKLVRDFIAAKESTEPARDGDGGDNGG